MKGLINPLSPHDALKHQFTSLKTYQIFLQLGAYNENFHETGLPILGNFKPHQVISIHYKSRIAAAIRAL